MLHAPDARDRDLPRRSVEILRDLGLSKEKIVAYHRRFPTPPTSCGYRPMTRVVLAAAHLDSDPTNNRLKNSERTRLGGAGA